MTAREQRATAIIEQLLKETSGHVRREIVALCGRSDPPQALINLIQLFVAAGLVDGRTLTLTAEGRQFLGDWVR